jgi:hypothetical protein
VISFAGVVQNLLLHLITVITSRLKPGGSQGGKTDATVSEIVKAAIAATEEPMRGYLTLATEQLIEDIVGVEE